VALLLPVATELPNPSPVIFGSRRLWATAVFDAYWNFAVERQRVFFRRLLGDTPPWTDDSVLRVHRFTNAYRASDRVSQFLITRVIPKSYSTPRDAFFRVLLFKIFNRIDTWRRLESALGELHVASFEVDRYNGVLDQSIRRGDRVYSAAYIMPVPKFGASRKHTNHLLLLKLMLEQELPERITAASTMEAAYELLLGYPSIGPFLAYQFIIDLNYSGITSFEEMEFVVPGPGAVDGIRKCFSDTGGLSDADVIRAMADIAGTQFQERGLTFPDLWGRPMQLIDFQNLFCEIDKYARVTQPMIAGRSGRQRIKRKYRQPNPEPLVPGYPSKWKLPRAGVALDGRNVPYPAANSGATEKYGP